MTTQVETRKEGERGVRGQSVTESATPALGQTIPNRHGGFVSSQSIEGRESRYAYGRAAQSGAWLKIGIIVFVIFAFVLVALGYYGVLDFGLMSG